MINFGKPRLIFWELTKRCNLKCIHCRAEALNKDFKAELDTNNAKQIIDDISSFAKPILVLTGGEPLSGRISLPLQSMQVKKACTQRSQQTPLS